MLDENTQAILHEIFLKALTKCDEAMDDHDYHEACHLIDIAKDCDHICRKNKLLEASLTTAK